TVPLAGAGLVGLVRPGPLEPRLVVGGAPPVTGHRMGPFPALLDPGEAADQCLRGHRSAAVRAEPRFRVVHAERRSAGPRRGRTPVAARGHDAVGMQAAWPHAVWLSKTAPAAAGSFARHGKGREGRRGA